VQCGSRATATDGGVGRRRGWRSRQHAILASPPCAVAAAHAAAHEAYSSTPMFESSEVIRKSASTCRDGRCASRGRTSPSRRPSCRRDRGRDGRRAEVARRPKVLRHFADVDVALGVDRVVAAQAQARAASALEAIVGDDGSRADRGGCDDKRSSLDQGEDVVGPDAEAEALAEWFSSRRRVVEVGQAVGARRRRRGTSRCLTRRISLGMV